MQLNISLEILFYTILSEFQFLHFGKQNLPFFIRCSITACPRENKGIRRKRKMIDHYFMEEEQTNEA